MSLTQKILSELKDISNTQSVKKHGKYIVGTAIFDVRLFDDILGKIDLVVDPIIKNGEKILSNIDSGEVIDSGIKQFTVLRGVSIEVYDYKATTAIFIRLYHIQDKKREWLALYIDENPSTPWWTEEERLT